MKKLTAFALAFSLGAAVALACSPTSWAVADLIYNLQQLDQEAQESTVLHLYSTRDGYTGYGQYAMSFRFVCYQAVASAPTGCELPAFVGKPRKAAKRSADGPGPGPGACYVHVVDWGQESNGGDLTAASCAAQTAILGMAVQ